MGRAPAEIGRPPAGPSRRGALLPAAGILAALLCPAAAARAEARAAPAAGAAAAPAAPLAAQGGGLSSPLVSGLSWRSGARSGPCVAPLRGRPLDAVNVFVGHDSFPAAVSSSAVVSRVGALAAPLLVVSLPLLTSSTRGQFARCADGAFDASWRQIGANIKRAGAREAVVRLGWEANIGSRSHPWGVDRADQVPAYKACWRHAAAQLKAGGPGIKVEWTNAKKTANRSIRVLDMYPGDDAVDLWGVHYYDSGPTKSTQGIWDQYYRIAYNGGPWGLGAWLEAARAHGKKLGVAEWAVWQQGARAGAADNPVYIDNMYRFFRDHAPDIAYETYFNSQPVHQLCPGTRFPRAAARYKADWGR